jgi:AbiJ N-terminal domain 4
MAIFDTFSKRQKRLESAGRQDVYQYDLLPNGFRIQVIQIWQDAVGVYYEPRGYGERGRSPANEAWDAIHKLLTKELGVFRLSDTGSDSADHCKNFILQADTSGALDIIHTSFLVIDRAVREMSPYDCVTAQIKQTPDDAIEELNERFREHGIGYQYVGGILVKLDSQFAHAEVVKPALALLNAEGFDGPADEFIQAFNHYRHGLNKEAVAEALKAFESTMKSICDVREWTRPLNATAKPLIDILFKNGLIPSELESHFSGLRSAMESGLPTLSNRTSRHGQGVVPIQIPPYFAAYALHLTASNIVFLVEAHKALA